MSAVARGPGWGVLYDPALVSDPAPDLMARLRARSVDQAGAERGRGKVVFVAAADQQWVLRHYRRGGLIARFIEDAYPWLGESRTRSFREWRMLARLDAAGLPVPRPVAASWRRRGAFYRADLVTVRIPGAAPLSSRLAVGAEIDWRGIGRTLRSFHEHGAFHADLNAHNILLDATGAAWLLDFDRGRFRDPGRWQQRNLARLERSLRKIAAEPGAPAFNEQGWARLRAGYSEGGPAA